jgi:hypothetical protein
MADAGLQGRALSRSLAARTRFLGPLTHVPSSLLGGSAPHAHVIELVSNEYLCIAAYVEASGSNFCPYYLDANASSNIPNAQAAVTAAADDDFTLGAQAQCQHRISVPKKRQLSHLAPSGGVE